MYAGLYTNRNVPGSSAPPTLDSTLSGRLPRIDPHTPKPLFTYPNQPLSIATSEAVAKWNHTE
ncbi:hypothetical protein OF001_U20339 [Pseudomonas sp. OF001]|nr:hypothetical protein OF001_U20339 [Pseudomonas sp. OF001]